PTRPGTTTPNRVIGPSLDNIRTQLQRLGLVLPPKDGRRQTTTPKEATVRKGGVDNGAVREGPVVMELTEPMTEFGRSLVELVEEELARRTQNLREQVERLEEEKAGLRQELADAQHGFEARLTEVARKAAD